MKVVATWIGGTTALVRGSTWPSAWAARLRLDQGEGGGMEESGSWDRESEADSSDAGRRRDNLGRPGRFPDVVTTPEPRRPRKSIRDYVVHLHESCVKAWFM